MTTTTQEPPSTARAVAIDYIAPRVDIREEKDGYLLQAEMPGVGKQGVEVTVEDRELTIIGRRAESPEKAELLYRESRPFDYRRTFELDATIDTGRIEAKVDQGVLTLRLPKQEAVKPRKIVVAE